MVRAPLVLGLTVAVLAGGLASPARAGDDDKWAGVFTNSLRIRGIERTNGAFSAELQGEILDALANALDADGDLPWWRPGTPIIYRPMPDAFQVGYGRHMYRLGDVTLEGETIGIFGDMETQRDAFEGVSIGDGSDEDRNRGWLEAKLVVYKRASGALALVTDQRTSGITEMEAEMVRALALRLGRVEELGDSGTNSGSERMGHIGTALDLFIQGLGNLDLDRHPAQTSRYLSASDFHWDRQVVDDFVREVASMEVNPGTMFYDEGSDIATNALELLEEKVGYYIQFFPKEPAEYDRNHASDDSDEYKNNEMVRDHHRFAAYYSWLGARGDVSGDTRSHMRASYANWTQLKARLTERGVDTSSGSGTLGR